MYIRTAQSAKEAWENLQKHFEEKSLSRKIFYWRKLYSARMAKETDMIDHINYVKTLAEHLEAVDDAVLEKDLSIILISSLPEEYNYLITALETIADEKLTRNYVQDRLIHEFDKMKNGNAGDKAEGDSSHDALISKQTSTTNYKPPDNKKIKCFYCQKKGHIAKTCFKKKADSNKQKETEEKSSKVTKWTLCQHT